MTSELKHIGTPRHSGRYPWGSGGNPQQRNTSFLGRIKELHKQGLDDTEISKNLGVKTTYLRPKKTIEKDKKWLEDSTFAMRLKDKGVSAVEIGRRMGRNESSVRGLLDPILRERRSITMNIANSLRTGVADKKYIDISLGVENHLGINRTKLKASVLMLKEEEGYTTHTIYIPQFDTGKNTGMLVLAAPGVTTREVYIAAKENKIRMLTDHFEDGGRSTLGLEPIRNIDSKRIKIKYLEDGGADKDGMIELRRNVPDLSLTSTTSSPRYAQVRVGVDGTHYMKGMAVYSDNVPDGYDVIYNSKKKRGSDKVFKPMKEEDDQIVEDNPFGSTVWQKHYIDANGKKQLSALNVVGTEKHPYEEGAWDTWSKSLSSQVLSKQLPALAKKQLAELANQKHKEFNELESLTNPAVKKVLLKDFADQCDADSVELKAAAMPRQSSRVLISFKTINEKEVYAPSFDNGESVVLIRHPHGGIFEIPVLTVNNKNPEAIKTLGADSRDAIGINPKVARKLSGADFDGDTVIVIPNKSGAIKTSSSTSSSIESLRDFDPQESYKHWDGMPRLTPKGKELQMGLVSNLITDMTIKGANEDEIVRAVKHSMVVIDANNHYLDYKRSAIDHNIADLKKLYQGGATSGAATLISKAGSQSRPLHRKEYILDPETIHIDPETGKVKGKRISIDPVTGKKLYTPTGESYTINLPNKRGPFELNPATGEKKYLTEREKIIQRTVKSTKMAETDDAHTLSSGYRMETIYADHANDLKSLANKARVSMLETPDLVYSHSASITYKNEVKDLNSKLNDADMNKPLERQARLMANNTVLTKKQANPELKDDHDALKKIQGQALVEARLRSGGGKKDIKITDREWEAIQAGAISNSKLMQILLNTKAENLKARALPRSSILMSGANLTRAKSMRASGNTTAEIASALGVSVSTLNKAFE